MCLWKERGGKRDLFPGEGILWYTVRKVSPPFPLRSHRLLRHFPGFLSAVFINVTDRATLTTVGHAIIFAGSHGGCGESVTRLSIYHFLTFSL